ncbi:hypothetical protein PLICRDRAFT_56088 [Plicaturopsis crispa FD-325 SS-3]|nr:hypothetical protein PLICRDRAFT_56088 [Plicaturopsis crispa FD-325 SS-3]
MPELQSRGKLGAATIAFYAPILVLTGVLVLRHGFRRDAGWIFLFVFSIVRILGGAMTIAAELVTPVNANLYVTTLVLQGVGLSPLLLSTLAFLRIICQPSFSSNPRLALLFRLLNLVPIAGLVLSIIGGTDSTSDSASTVAQGKTLRRVGAWLFVAIYVVAVVVHVGCWLNSRALLRHRRNLLKGISLALPFLAVRLAYSVLSTYASNGFSVTSAATSSTTPASLHKFNALTGSWALYLVMALLMEYIVVGIYITVGVLTPISKEEVDYEAGERGSGETEMVNKPAYRA